MSYQGRVEDQQQYIEVLQSAEGAGNVRAQTASKKVRTVHVLQTEFSLTNTII